MVFALEIFYKLICGLPSHTTCGDIFQRNGQAMGTTGKVAAMILSSVRRAGVVLPSMVVSEGGQKAMAETVLPCVGSGLGSTYFTVPSA